MIIKRALISVSDKSGIVDFCSFLQSRGVELISTGGTAKVLSENRIPYTPIESVTGNPESFGGRMKTISFEIGSALLYRRNHEGDLKQAKELNIEPIDMVICNLYPFQKVVREKGSLPELIENIDIGGPMMIRAAAKNYESVACVVSPNDYGRLKSEILETGQVCEDTRQKLALEAFTQIASYDLAIALELTHQFGKGLRYGENPHQRASLLKIDNTDSRNSLSGAKILQGKELSYNNYLDLDQAYKCASELNALSQGDAVSVIVKHGIPCGVATHPELIKALELAWNADSTSAFGGILSFNREISEDLALWLKDKFVEVILAPKFSEASLKVFSLKKNLRLLQCELKNSKDQEWTVRSIHGGVLAQDEDQGISTELKSVAKIPFPDKMIPLTRFGLTVTKYMKSNCIGIFSEKDGGYAVLASGVGQPNRLDCITRLAAGRLKEKNEDLKNAILVSDAFFPFRDSIEAAKELNIKFIVQPGGSIRDEEVIEACNEFGMAMLFTGKRHFRH